MTEYTTGPMGDAPECLASANLEIFLAAVRDRGGQLDGEPVRDPSADHGGRFGWHLPVVGGNTIRLEMPGVKLDPSDKSAEAPYLRVNGNAWWWNDALSIVVPLVRYSTRR